MSRSVEACTVEDQILGILKSQYGEHGRMLRVDLEEGRVVLRGQAQSFYQKQLWLRGAIQVAGSNGIVDLTEVYGPPSEVENAGYA